MHATTGHWEHPHCQTLRCIDACCEVTKRWHLLYWFVWGSARVSFILLIFICMWLNVLAVQKY